MTNTLMSISVIELAVATFDALVVGEIEIRVLCWTANAGIAAFLIVGSGFRAISDAGAGAGNGIIGFDIFFKAACDYEVILVGRSDVLGGDALS